MTELGNSLHQTMSHNLLHSNFVLPESLEELEHFVIPMDKVIAIDSYCSICIALMGAFRAFQVTMNDKVR